MSDFRDLRGLLAGYQTSQATSTPLSRLLAAMVHTIGRAGLQQFPITVLGTELVDVVTYFPFNVGVGGTVIFIAELTLIDGFDQGGPIDVGMGIIDSADIFVSGPLSTSALTIGVPSFLQPGPRGLTRYPTVEPFRVLVERPAGPVPTAGRIDLAFRYWIVD